MKKVLLVLLALIMVLSMMTSAMAVPGANNPGQAKKNAVDSETEELTETTETSFDDLLGFKWAEKEIEFMAERGVLKGEGNNKFVPNRPVKEIEVIVMMLRMLNPDMEETIDSEIPLPGWFNRKSLKADSWMVPYIGEAGTRFSENENFKSKFNPNKPAKREDVAFYIQCMLELLDYDLELDKSLLDSDVLENIYIDGVEVSLENKKAVLLMNSLELMIGNEKGEFQPNKPITRAECAMLMHRLFNNYSFEFDEYYYGEKFPNTTLAAITLESEDDNTTLQAITIETEDGDILYDEFVEELKISIKNSCCDDAGNVNHEELESFIGQKVWVKANNGVVSEIKIYCNELKGQLTKIDSRNDLHLIPDGESEPVEFDYKNDFDNNVKFFKNGLEISRLAYKSFDIKNDIEYKVELKLLEDGDINRLCISYEVDEN